jgi:prepilin-type N-terminal cleavage/methylation domain-containing protein
MSNTYSRRSDRRGLTLVEVIAGLVLLATLLTAVLGAFKTHAAQIRGARDRLKASAAAEELLSGWLAQGALPALGTQKPLAGADGWNWRLTANEPQQSGTVNIGSIRVEIFRLKEAAREDVLASVSLVVPGNTIAGK